MMDKKGRKAGNSLGNKYVEKDSIDKQSKIEWMIFIKNMAVVTVAACVYGIGISIFLDSNNLVPGGVSGLAIIVNRLVSIETGTVIFLINIPILIIGLWKFGKSFILKSLYAIIVSSTIINIFSNIGAVTEDKFLASLFGGAMVAWGLGTILKRGASTGGMDIIVQLIRLKYKHLKTGTVFLMTDIIIVSLSIFVFDKIEYALYSAITGVVCSLGMDIVLYWKDEARLLYIIVKSKEREAALVERLLRELEVGVTYLSGYGAYKNSEKRVIMCAVRKNQMPKAKEIVKDTDDTSFMIVTSANEIIGQGYKSHHMKSL